MRLGLLTLKVGFGLDRYRHLLWRVRMRLVNNTILLRVPLVAVVLDLYLRKLVLCFFSARARLLDKPVKV